MNIISLLLQIYFISDETRSTSFNAVFALMLNISTELMGGYLVFRIIRRMYRIEDTHTSKQYRTIIKAIQEKLVARESVVGETGNNNDQKWEEALTIMIQTSQIGANQIDLIRQFDLLPLERLERLSTIARNNK